MARVKKIRYTNAPKHMERAMERSIVIPRDVAFSGENKAVWDYAQKALENQKPAAVPSLLHLDIPLGKLGSALVSIHFANKPKRLNKKAVTAAIREDLVKAMG